MIQLIFVTYEEGQEYWQGRFFVDSEKEADKLAKQYVSGSVLRGVAVYSLLGAIYFHGILK